VSQYSRTIRICVTLIFREFPGSAKPIILSFN